MFFIIDANNGAYTGNSREGRASPVSAKLMKPAHSTDVAPPEAGENEVAVWSGKRWSIKPDHRGTEYWLADRSHHTIAEIDQIPPEDALDAAPPTPREDQRSVALARVDEEHSNYLVKLTGGATVAERDTWKVKEEAARAYLILEASDGQIAMLAAEAAGSGITKDVLSAKIVAKAEAFLALIGAASGLRAQGRTAVLAATGDAVPLDQVADQLEAVFAQLAEQVVAAIEALHAGA